MITKPHTNIAPERFTQPVQYMTQAKISAFEAAHNVSPWIGAVLNLVPGVGYLYCRSWKLGLAAILVLAVLYVKALWLFLLGYAWLPIDGYYCALANNSRLLRDERRRHNDW
jgi:hypothetical protein